jgi:hypothetical protein
MDSKIQSNHFRGILIRPREEGRVRAAKGRVDQLQGNSRAFFSLVPQLSDSTWMFRHTPVFCLHPGMESPRFVENMGSVTDLLSQV